ncbi:hypothetical protein [Aquimarina latercula]|uniref:hypothetical protein n=1 Tax=Aquimarina latercula TaxID=987 RepID=UPI00042A2F46|nr:hypothetical protein [Aquimarina latercula]
MNRRSNSLTKTTSSLLEKKAKRNELTTVIIVSTFGLIGFLAPFSHVFFNNTDTPGMFGFKKMSSLLYAIGFPLLSISAGLILYFGSKVITGKLAGLFSKVSFLFFFVGIFFLVWALAPSIPDDFPAFVYYFSMVVVSLYFSRVMRIFSNYILGLTGKIEKMIELVGNIRVNHFFKMAYKASDKANIEEINADIEDFDNEVFEVLDEVSKD